MDAELWVYLEGFLSAEPPPPPPAGFVQIPAGSFLMGAPADELGSRIDERPQHTVTLTRSLPPAHGDPDAQLLPAVHQGDQSAAPGGAPSRVLWKAANGVVSGC